MRVSGEDGDLEVKQGQQVSQYENMQITAVLQPYPCDKDIFDNITQTSSGTFRCISLLGSFDSWKMTLMK